MNEHTSGDIDTHGGGGRPPCTGLTPDVLPEVQKPVLAENSQTGVSTRNAHIASKPKAQKEELVKRNSRIYKNIEQKIDK